GLGVESPGSTATRPHAPRVDDAPVSEPAENDSVSTEAPADDRSVEARMAQLSAELRAAHARLSLFAGSSLMGQMVHREGVLLDANERFLDMTGYRREELVGRPIVNMVVDPESRELIRQRVQLGLDGKYFVIGLHRG